MEYQSEFPHQKQSKYLSASDFQDNEITLTFMGWKKKANEDDPSNRKGAMTWKEKLKYQLRYSYPEFATDEAGEKRLGKDGLPFKNSNYDPDYPHGYSIVYLFAEGEFESGSLPLFRQFCFVRPKQNEIVKISRTGKDKETVWGVKRAKSTDLPVIDVDQDMKGKDQYGADLEVPF